ASGQVVSRDSAVVPPANLDDAEVVHDERRTRGVKHGPIARSAVFAPQLLPSGASRQNGVPRTLSVTTFPSATAGELPGPACPEAGPVTPCASYLSCQSSFPVAASSLGQFFGPSLRRAEPSRFGVSVGPALLRPILRPDAVGTGQQRTTQHHAPGRIRVS